MTVDVAVIVPAAGSGERLGAGVPKALAPLAGEPILAHAVRAMVAEPRVRQVVVAAPPGLEDVMRRVAQENAADAAVRVVTGGATRVESVARALDVVPGAVEVVLVHDAARCLVPSRVVAGVVDAVLAGATAVVPAVAVVDTIREVGSDGRSRTIDRSALRAVQTPQGFAAGPLRRAHGEPAPGATDDAGMVEALGYDVVLVPGHPDGFKVTSPLDLLLAHALLAQRGGGPAAGPVRRW